MTITIRLNADERSALEKALGILGHIEFKPRVLNNGMINHFTRGAGMGDNERSVLEKAVGIIGRIAFMTGVSNRTVFDYLKQVAEIDDTCEYHIKAIHSINKIKASRRSK